jgi:hypothetical protein
MATEKLWLKVELIFKQTGCKLVIIAMKLE